MDKLQSNHVFLVSSAARELRQTSVTRSLKGGVAMGNQMRQLRKSAALIAKLSISIVEITEDCERAQAAGHSTHEHLQDLKDAYDVIEEATSRGLDIVKTEKLLHRIGVS